MTKDRPTNQQVVKMLDQIMRELGDIKKRQHQLLADLDKIHLALKQ